MDLPVTLVFCAVFVALALACGWLGARPPDPRRGPRMAPWRFLMILAACVAFVGVVHLVNLLGVTTGR
jgi:hypothetical protein